MRAPSRFINPPEWGNPSHSGVRGQRSELEEEEEAASSKVKIK